MARRIPRARPAEHPRCPKNAKLRYRSQRAAENVLRELVLYGSPKQVVNRAYPCDHCKGWHLTSKQRKRAY